MEALVTFSKPYNYSGVSQKERILPTANTVQANWGHDQKHKKNPFFLAACVVSWLASPIGLEMEMFNTVILAKVSEYLEFW